MIFPIFRKNKKRLSSRSVSEAYLVGKLSCMFCKLQYFNTVRYYRKRMIKEQFGWLFLNYHLDPVDCGMD